MGVMFAEEHVSNPQQSTKYGAESHSSPPPKHPRRSTVVVASWFGFAFLLQDLDHLRSWRGKLVYGVTKISSRIKSGYLSTSWRCSRNMTLNMEVNAAQKLFRKGKSTFWSGPESDLNPTETQRNELQRAVNTRHPSEADLKGRMVQNSS